MIFKVSNDYGSYYFTTLEGANDYQFQTGGTISEVPESELAESVLAGAPADHPSALAAAPADEQPLTISFTNELGEWALQITGAACKPLQIGFYNQAFSDWEMLLREADIGDMLILEADPLLRNASPDDLVLTPTGFPYRFVVKEGSVYIKKISTGRIVGVYPYEAFSAALREAVEEARRRGLQFADEEELAAREPTKGEPILISLKFDDSNWRLYISDGTQYVSVRFASQRKSDWEPLLSLGPKGDPAGPHISIKNAGLSHEVFIRYDMREIWILKPSKLPGPDIIKFSTGDPLKFSAALNEAIEDARKEGFRFEDEVMIRFAPWNKVLCDNVWNMDIFHGSWSGRMRLQDQSLADWMGLAEAKVGHELENDGFPYRVAVEEESLHFRTKKGATVVVLPKAEFFEGFERGLRKAQAEGLRPFE